MRSARQAHVSTRHKLHTLPRPVISGVGQLRSLSSKTRLRKSTVLNFNQQPPTVNRFFIRSYRANGAKITPKVNPITKQNMTAVAVFLIPRSSAQHCMIVFAHPLASRFKLPNIEFGMLDSDSKCIAVFVRTPERLVFNHDTECNAEDRAHQRTY